MLWPLCFWVWIITGDTLTYYHENQCTIIKGNARAADEERNQKITADIIKANSVKAKNPNGDDQAQNQQEFWAEGSVHFVTPTLDVVARQAHFDPRHRTIRLDDRVVVCHHGHVVKGDSVTIDLDKQTYRMQNPQGTFQKGVESINGKIKSNLTQKG